MPQSLDALLHGQHRWLSRRGQSQPAHQFGRFFTGRITAAAGRYRPPGIGDPVPVWPVWPPSGPPVPSVPSCVHSTPRLEVAEQIRSMGVNSLKLDFGGEDSASSDGYAKVMSIGSSRPRWSCLPSRPKWTSSSPRP